MNAFIQLEQKLHVLSRWANPPHLLKGVWMAHSARVTTDGDACRHCEASLHRRATAQEQNTEINDLPGSHTKKK